MSQLEKRRQSSYLRTLSTARPPAHHLSQTHYLFQSGSMVEIKQETADAPPPPAEDGAKYRLIYAKSKVYVNTTAYARDNIPGFVTIVKRVREPFISL